ncbi:protein TolR [bacterium]|nr:protein TolR [bacterium]
MGFDTTDDQAGVIAQINVTPLVDVMLVLLIIFMVAAPILQQGAELQLPQETISPLEGDEEQLVVNIQETGQVSIGKDNTVDIASLGSRLQGILERRSDKRVFIRADKRVDYGRVMAVMAQIKNAGIEKVGLVTEPK